MYVWNSGLQLRGVRNLTGCIHHTDGGSQYFSKHYLHAIKSHNICISVAGNCLENGYAEQQNYMLKHHFLPTLKDCEVQDLSKEIDRIKHEYNYERKQEKLGWMIPVEIEQRWCIKADRPTIKLYDFEKEKGNDDIGF